MVNSRLSHVDIMRSDGRSQYPDGKSSGASIGEREPRTSWQLSGRTQKQGACIGQWSHLIGIPSHHNAVPLPPKAELAWWYQFYCRQAEPREARTYSKNTHEFNSMLHRVTEVDLRGR